MSNRILILLACIAISGCAQITPYRMPFAADAKPCVAQTASECSGDAYYYLVNKIAPKLDDIPIGIVEFDDQGVLQDRPSKEVIMDRIRWETDEHGAFVVVFAHGWLNNAAPDNGNLAEFQALLKRIAADDMRICEGRTCANRKVVGVYLAWRGMSATLEPFKSLSFWNRKTRAERVGQDGATEILADLAQTQRGGKSDEVMRAALAKTQVDGKPPRKSCMPDLAQNPDKVPCNRTKSRLIVIGHSFGGAVVYSATQQLLMKDAASELGDKSVDRKVADMVILVNPAFEAARLTSLHDRAAGMKFPVTQSPILAIFTSETDYATKLAFPMGRYISSLFTRYNPGQEDQPALDRTAVGHYAGYQTHELRLADKAATLVPRKKIRCGWEGFFGDSGQSWNLGPVLLKRKKTEISGHQRMNPYYNVVVDDAVISGHSRIWEPRFMEFITRFVMVQDERLCKDLPDD